MSNETENMTYEGRGYVRNLSEVKQVIETTDLGKVNELIHDGWMLLGVAKSTGENILFSLGLVTECSKELRPEPDSDKPSTLAHGKHGEYAKIYTSALSEKTPIVRMRVPYEISCAFMTEISFKKVMDIALSHFEKMLNEEGYAPVSIVDVHFRYSKDMEKVMLFLEFGPES